MRIRDVIEAVARIHVEERREATESVFELVVPIETYLAGAQSLGDAARGKGRAGRGSEMEERAQEFKA
jgi:hypothetical protein